MTREKYSNARLSSNGQDPCSRDTKVGDELWVDNFEKSALARSHIFKLFPGRPAESESFDCAAYFQQSFEQTDHPQCNENHWTTHPFEWNRELMKSQDDIETRSSSILSRTFQRILFETASHEHTEYWRLRSEGGFGRGDCGGHQRRH